MSYREINVLYDNGQHTTPVGRLATSGANTVFEYDDAWVKYGLELAPFRLPIAKRSFTLDSRSMVASTFGLFADSLPDGWGTLLMDRWFKKHGSDRSSISPLDRLVFLGGYAMGALSYAPPLQTEYDNLVEAVNVGEMAREAYELYEGRIEDAGCLLAQIGGFSWWGKTKGLDWNLCWP